MEELKKRSTSVHYAQFSWMMFTSLIHSIVRFRKGGEADWHCYHPAILCGDVKQELLQESEWLKVFIRSDLEQLACRSKIEYSPHRLAPSHSSDKCSIYFVPLNDDDRDEFIDLLADELIYRRMSTTGELEELY